MLEIELIEYSGLVYDLMIDKDESFVADGIVVHNCSMVPVVKGFPLPEFQTGEEWFKNQSPAVQLEMMGKKRLEAWQNGRFQFKQLATVGEHEVWGPTAQVTAVADLLKGGGGRGSGNGKSPAVPVEIEPKRPPIALPPVTFSGPEAAHDWGIKTHQSTADNLDDKQRETVMDYQLTDYRWINAELRSGKGINDESKKAHAILDSVINASSVPEPVTVYRGMNSKYLQNLEIGDEFTDKGYCSTTLAKEKTSLFIADAIENEKEPVLVEIVLPVGTKAFYLDSVWDREEREMLLARDSRFIVDEIGESSFDFYGDEITIRRVVMRVLP